METKQQLTYNGIAFHELGEVVVSPPAARYEPAGAPQRVVYTFTARIHVFEPAWEENYDLLRQCVTALQTTHALLTWLDEHENPLVNRPVSVVSHTFPAAGETVHATYHQELEVTFEWTDHALTGNALGTTYQRGGSSTVVNLGQVDDFAQDYARNGLSPHRSERRDAAGRVNLSGRITAAGDATLAARRTALAALLDTLMTEIVEGKDGTLTHGSFVNRVVRIESFTARINQAVEHIEWSMSASFTWHPDESDYAIVEYRLATRADPETGQLRLSLTGEIDAPTLAAASTALSNLRTANVDSSWQQIEAESTPARAETDDGAVFLTLSFSEEYQKHSGDVLHHTRRIETTDAVAGGLVDVVYSGTVRARGSSASAALSTALTRARSLGKDKEATIGGGAIALEYREVTTEQQQLTDGNAIAEVEYSYPYRKAGGRVYLEETAEQDRPVFEAWTESVSGFVVAADHATCETQYGTQVRAAYNARALLDEKKSFVSQERVTSTAGALAVRMNFSFRVPITRTSSVDRAVKYALRTRNDYRARKTFTTVNGVIVAESQALAESYLTTFLSGLGSLGEQVTSESGASLSSGRNVQGTAPVATFYQLEFSAEYEKKLDGDAGILQCEVEEEVQYAGVRWVAHPIPGGTTVMQSAGIEHGQRSVRGSCVATNATDALAWAQLQREYFIAGPYEGPPRISKSYDFPMKVEGDVDAGNFSAVRLTFLFTETLPSEILA